MDQPFLDQLAPADRANLRARLVVSTASEGAFLLEQGDRRGTLRVILKGAAKVVRAMPGTSPGIVLTYLVEGDVFGEISFLDGATASASVVAEGGSCEIGELGHGDLEKVMAEDPGLAGAIYRALATTLATRLRETSARVRSDATHVPKPGDSAPPLQSSATDNGAEPVESQFRQRLATLADRFRRARSAGASPEEIDALPIALSTFVRWAWEAQALAPPADEILFREIFPALVESPTVASILMAATAGRSESERFSLLLDEVPGGDSLLQRTMDSWFLNLPTAVAARAATAAIRHELLHAATTRPRGPDEPFFRVARLGATHRCETLGILRSTETSHTPLRVTILDGSSKALMAVAAAVERTAHADAVSFVQAWPFARGSGAGTRLLPQHAMVVCGGGENCDDAAFVEGLRWIRQQLRPGGVFYLSHLADGREDAAIFENLLDWPIVGRSPEEVAGHLREAGFERTKITRIDLRTEGCSLFSAKV